MSGEREQNWYPIGKVGWFARHLHEGIEVTAGQPALLRAAVREHAARGVDVIKVIVTGGGLTEGPGRWRKRTGRTPGAISPGPRRLIRRA